MTSTPTPNVRLTISVTPEVHATFQRLAKGSGMSISKAMGEWLGDTLEAADFMATKIEQARAAPRIVMQEMHAYALGLADETGAVVERMRHKDREGRVREPLGRARGPRDPVPPSGNTGGKGGKGGSARTDLNSLLSGQGGPLIGRTNDLLKAGQEAQGKPLIGRTNDLLNLSQKRRK